MEKIIRERYTFTGRLKSGIETFKEIYWCDGYKFTLFERIKRSVKNFNDIPFGENYNHTCRQHSNEDNFKEELLVHVINKIYELRLLYEILVMMIKKNKEKENELL